MNNCKFCGIKLEKNDRICPNCGGAVTGEIIDVEKLEKTIDKQEDTIEELQNNVNKYKDKHSKKSALIVVLIIIIVFMIIFPMTCCILIASNATTTNDDYEQNYLYEDDDEYVYDYSDDDYKTDSDVVFNEENIVDLGDEVIINLNGKSGTILSLAGDFINGMGLDMEETYIINSKSSDYVRNSDMSVSLNVENSSDEPLNYTECRVIGITLYTKEYYGDYSGVDSLEFHGITLDSKPDDAIDLFGTPSLEYVNDYSIYKEWDVEDGWFEISWTLDEKLKKISYHEFGNGY